MKRDFEELSRRTYDLIIVGGGIYGACASWEAALRGLSVALVEKGDFGGATSSNSSKIAHGGFRYLQHADFKRMRQSIRERATLMRISPHLVHYQPFLLPTYGHATRGKEIMSVALRLNDLFSRDRLYTKAPSKLIPKGRIITREESLRIAPGIKKERLTGGAIWYDGQIRNTERLTLSFIHSAVQAGAVAANYAEVTGFMMEGDRVVGVQVKDHVGGRETEIRADVTLNAAGPWAGEILRLLPKPRKGHEVALSKVFTLVTRRLTDSYAVAVVGNTMYRDRATLARKGGQLLFAIPWANRSLVGSMHLPYEGHPEGCQVTEEDLESLINEFNEACPGAQLKRQDVFLVLSGLVPAEEENSAAPLKHYQICDHEDHDGIKGIVTVIGVKYTTARDVAGKAVDVVVRKLGKGRTQAKTSTTPLWGGDIEHLDDFVAREASKPGSKLSPRTIVYLIENYGSRYGEITKYLDESPVYGEHLAEGTETLKAQVMHAIREEMAVKLSDVVFRRTELGSRGNPGREALRACASMMARELGWDDVQKEKELSGTEARFGVVSRSG